MILKSENDKNKGSLYVITAYKFNHIDRNIPIDPRFMIEGIDTKFYLVDEAGASPGLQCDYVEERLINPDIAQAGARLLAEWSFLLTEFEKPFATYPFFMVSSRFFEKNERLPRDFSAVMAASFDALEAYGWGYLPSYNRDANFQDLLQYRKAGYLGIKDEGIAFIDGICGIRFIDEYRYVSDFFCNYIGFKSRNHLIAYVEFYLPFIRRFLDAKWNRLRDPELYVRRTNTYRNEKPFTFLLEMMSHLFFYMNRLKFAGVSYDGIYEVDESAIVLKPLVKWRQTGAGRGI